MASGGDGGARGREGEGARGGDEHGESERASRGPRGVSRGSRKRAGRQEEVEAGGGRGCTRRRHASAYWREEEGDREEAVVGWAGQLQCWAGWWRQVSAPGRLSLSLWFFYLLMFSIFCNWF